MSRATGCGSAMWAAVAIGCVALAGCSTTSSGADASSASAVSSQSAPEGLTEQTRALIIGTSNVVGTDPQVKPWPEVFDTAPPFLTFAADGSVTLYSGCNRGAGTFEVSGASVTLGPIALTRMACPPEQMAVENRITSLLSEPLEARESTQSPSSAAGEEAEWELRGQSGALLLRAEKG